MRKALLLGSMASLAALSFGCAMTDYAAQTGSAAYQVAPNASHGIIDARTADRKANAQQTIESATRDMLYTNTGGFVPTATPGNFVGAEDARDWNRFIGSWAPVQGAGARGFAAGFDGQWEMGGVKLLADGTRRVSTYNSVLPPSGFNIFSCGFGAGAPLAYRCSEGGVYGEKTTNAGALAARIPSFFIETICIDPGNSNAFGANLEAVTPNVIARGGYSTFLASPARTAENQVTFTPVTRHEGIAEFLAGQSMTIHVSDVTITGSGELMADGKIAARLLSMERNGVVYTAGDNPAVFVVDPSTNFRTVTVDGNPAEGVKLAQFAIDAGLTDVELNLAGIQVREVGLTLPEIAITISGEVLANYIDDVTNGGADGGGGFGG